MNEKELLQLERYLQEFDLSAWERDILIEFNKSKSIDELLEYIKEESQNDFLINLADGIKQYKHDMIKIKLQMKG